MGKRRVRNLQRIGGVELGGCDIRADRRAEAAARYGLRTHNSFDEAVRGNYDAVIISLPPDLHVDAATKCVSRNMPIFLEASVLLDGMYELAELVERAGLVAMPSCTMRYFPGPRAIADILAAGTIGSPLFWRYHAGQCLLDWHPWEPIADYYVSRRATGGCREIVPFELTWLTKVFGDVVGVRGRIARVGSLDADIDDVYMAEIQHDGGLLGQLTIDVLSRPAVRDFSLVCDSGTIRWNGIEDTLRYADRDGHWKEVPLARGHAEAGYINPEEPYEDEMRDFLASLAGSAAPAYTLRHDIRILEILSAIEHDSAVAQPTLIRP